MKKIHIFDHDAYHSVLQQQIGNGIPVFAGYRQQGAGLGNLLGLIGRYVIPLFKNHVLPQAKTSVLNAISDVAKGKSITDAVQDHGSAMIKNVGTSLLNHQSGRGLSTNSDEYKGLASVSSRPLSMVCHKRKPKTAYRKSKVSSKRKKPTKRSKAKKPTTKRKSVLSKRDIFS